MNNQLLKKRIIKSHHLLKQRKTSRNIKSHYLLKQRKSSRSIKIHRLIKQRKSRRRKKKLKKNRLLLLLTRKFIPKDSKIRRKNLKRNRRQLKQCKQMQLKKRQKRQMKMQIIKRAPLTHQTILSLIAFNSPKKIAMMLKSPRESPSRLSLRKARLTITVRVEILRISRSVTDLMRAPSSSLSNLSSRETKRVQKRLRLSTFAVASTTRSKVVPSVMAVTRISLSGDLTVYIFMIERTHI